MPLEQRPSVRTHVKGLQGLQLGTDPHGHTRTDRPALSSFLLSPGVSGFQRSLHEDCLLCSFPPLPAGASPYTVMPSRQLCGGSCLDQLKTDGWARIHGCPPGSEEAAAPWAWAQAEKKGKTVSAQGLEVGRYPFIEGFWWAAPSWDPEQMPGLCPSFHLGTRTQLQPLPLPTYNCSPHTYSSNTTKHTTASPTNTQSQHFHKHNYSTYRQTPS